MIEVLGKLNEGLSLLENKLEEVSKKELSLKNAKADLEATHAKNVAAENNLKAKERILVKYEDLDKEIELAKQKIQKVNDELAVAESKRLEYEKRIRGIASKEKETEELRSIFKRKNASLDEQLAKTKELQEQLKSKLQSLGIK